MSDSPIIQLLLILFVSWFLGRLFQKRLKLPPMLGELFAGLLFGPAILNIIHPSQYIEFLSELGVFFLMFYAGTETDPNIFFKSIKASIFCGFGGFIVPFIIGFYATTTLIPGVTTVQAMFVGLGLSTTAIAVNARILMDLKMTKSNIGNILIGSALVDDIICLGVFSALVDTWNMGEIAYSSIISSIAHVAGFFLISYAIGKLILPLVGRLYDEDGYGFTFALLTALVFAYLAELLGLHLVIGAFLAGLFVREEIKPGKVLDSLNDRLMIISYGFLGPVFFVSLAFHVEISALVHEFWFLLLLVLIALIGKFIGSYITLFAAGVKKAQRIVISIGMNGRGAVELILVAVGLKLGILSAQMGSILVSLAFITTFITPIAFKMILTKYQNLGLIKKGDK